MNKIIDHPGLFDFDSAGSNTALENCSVEIGDGDRKFLRQQQRPNFEHGIGEIRIVDLFCGAGGISLGLAEAAKAFDRKATICLGVDIEPRALAVFKENFPKANLQEADLLTMFNNDLEVPDLNEAELTLRKNVGKVDILVGGPPCQGHSDLNNFSRRNDPKNRLYFLMARAARVFQPSFVIIENVPGAKHDKGGTVSRTVAALANEGYHVTSEVIDMRHIGVPQSRKRLVIIAAKDRAHDIRSLLCAYRTKVRDVRWAIEDIQDETMDSIATIPSTPSRDNKERIDYLFDQELSDLPDEMRPPCHRDKNHSYKSIYGRLRWDEPSQTITSGFYSMCMGRYVHPSRRRTLTAHEAARLQFFPDYFSFEAAEKRTALAQIIGNAVPPKLSFVFGHYLIKQLIK